MYYTEYLQQQAALLLHRHRSYPDCVAKPFSDLDLFPDRYSAVDSIVWLTQKTGICHTDATLASKILCSA